MLKEYKKKFILSNLFLVDLVLLVMNVIIFVYSYRTAVRDLEMSMSRQLEPYEAMNDVLMQHSEKIAPPKQGTPPPKPQTDAKPRKDNKDISVFFYNTETQEISAISGDFIREEDTLGETAEKILNKTKDFGRLSGDGLYYFYRKTGSDVKIAIADISYIGYKVLKLILVLLLIFALTMLMIYCISRKMAAFARRPLEESIKREKQFITDISHDLKTPVTAVIANCDILAKNSGGANELKWIDATKKAAKNMQSLIEQMLILSKTDSQKRVDMKRLNFSDIADNAALYMESVAYEKNIEYNTDIAENIFIEANEDYTKRIVSSLIDNALKYEPEGGKIEISLKTSGAKAVFSVANKNTYIDAENIEHIFERFYRADKSRKSDGSHGLGLSIVKNLVELMDGKIKVKSSREDGTRFLVEFSQKKD